ncbi:hypothetical protein BU16DRAFT_580805 [Lophium mytilinum]|uniref:Myb-like domain-containing protein n=1 Tax=Lophium mytilinum TaxID=390894 RepID=A0A6A6R002_9PEZI|nr:hypothetical protein BU16DRAFT_580805 [Lophium mytilinum]
MARNPPPPRRVSRTSTLLFALGAQDTPFAKDKTRKSAPSTPFLIGSKYKKPSDTKKAASTPKDESNNKDADKKSGAAADEAQAPGAWVEVDAAAADDAAFDKKTDFTAQQDDMLLKLKIIEAKAWKDIASEVGKEVWEVKARWKDVRPTDEARWKQLNGYGAAPANSGGGGGGGGSGGGGKSGGGGGGGGKNNGKGGGKGGGGGGGAGGGGNDGKKNDKQKSNQKNSWQKQQQQQSHNFDVAEDADDEAGIADPFADPLPDIQSGDGVVELEEDDNFSQDELVMLCRLLHRDQRNLWLRIASQFYDKTGRKVHPMDIKEKLTGVAAAEHGG